MIQGAPRKRESWRHLKGHKRLVLRDVVTSVWLWGDRREPPRALMFAALERPRTVPLLQPCSKAGRAQGVPPAADPPASPSASSAISSSLPLVPDTSISSSSATGGKAASSF